MSPHIDGLSDVARRAWAEVTIRIAWTLLTRGIAPKSEVLRDVRDHVWFHLEAGVPTSLAVDVAERLCVAFIDRAQGRVPAQPWPEDFEAELPTHWRAPLHHGLSPRASWVLRMHFADGSPLSQVAEQVGGDLLGVEAAAEGLREVVRRQAQADGASIDDWPVERVDLLLHRLAARTAEGAPSLLEVVDGMHPEWLDRCVTCTRAYTLVRRRILQRGDLVPPRQRARPGDRVKVIALQVAPEARHLRKSLAKRIPGTAFPVGEDLLLLDGAALDAVRPALAHAAELGRPRKRHLRGVALEGPGRWSRHGLVGPLVGGLDEAVRQASWGHVEGVGELPERLPEPPSAVLPWAAVALLGLVSLQMLQTALATPPPPVDHPLMVEATPGRGGVWVDFDVDEEATLLVVREQGGVLDVLLDSQRAADKVRFAWGDGSYRLHTRGDAVLLASSGRRVGDVAALLAGASSDDVPLDALARRIRRQAPRADVWLYQRP